MSVPWLRLAQRPERRSSPCSSPLPTGSGWSPPTRRPSAATRDRGCARLGRPVDEDAADLAGLNSGVGGVACQGLVGGLVEGLMEVIVRFLVGALTMAPHSRAAVQRPLGDILSESRRSLVSVMPRSLRVFGRLDSSAAASSSLGSSWVGLPESCSPGIDRITRWKRLLRSPHVPWRPRWSCAAVALSSGDGRIWD